VGIVIIALLMEAEFWVFGFRNFR